MGDLGSVHRVNYVLGFIFDEQRKRILLIRKNRPDWQVGKLNGVGGKIEPGEHAVEAIIRETREGTGLVIPSCFWREIGSLFNNNESTVSVFVTTTHKLDSTKTLTDEELTIVDVANLPTNVIPNLKWLIPLLCDDEVDNMAISYQNVGR